MLKNKMVMAPDALNVKSEGREYKPHNFYFLYKIRCIIDNLISHPVFFMTYVLLNLIMKFFDFSQIKIKHISKT